MSAAILSSLFAKLTVLFGVLTASIYLLRIFKEKLLKNKLNFLNKLFGVIKKSHKFFGIAMIITGFTHGYLALGPSLLFNFGIVVWLITVLLFFSFYLRKIFRQKWLFYHRGLTVSLIIALVIHLILR